MKRLILCALLPLTVFAQQSHPPIEYGAATQIAFELYNADGTLDINEVDGGAEVTVFCYTGSSGAPTSATATNDFVDRGNHYSLDITASEAQCATVLLEIAATLTSTVRIPTIGNANAQVDDDGGWFTDIPWNTAWDAEVESEVTDANVADGLDHLVSAAVTGTDVVDNSIIAQLVGDDATADWDTYDNTTESFEAIRNRGDVAWTTGSGTGLTAIATGTAQSATATTLVLASAETFGDNELVGAVVQITGGTTGVGQSKCITDNVGATDTVTVDTWTTTPTGTITYEIAPSLGASCPLAESAVADAVRSEPCGTETADTLGDIICNDMEGLRIDVTTARAGYLDNINNHTAQTGDSFARIGANGAGLTGIPWNAVWDAEIESEALDALVSIYLDQLIANAYNSITPDGNAASLLNEMTENDGGFTRYTSNAVENAPTGADGWTSSEREEIRGRLGVTGTTAAGGNTPTLATQASVSALPSATDIWNITCEDQGGGYTCREVVNMLFAHALGTCTYNSGTRVWTCNDPSGTEARFSITQGPLLDGTRTSSSPTPFTP